MKWMTREWPKVDRIVCPWLMSRFIGPQPECLYVPADQVLHAAKQHGTLPDDVSNVDLGHNGPLCNSDTFMKMYGLFGTDPALERSGLIVCDADTSDKALTAESRGLEAMTVGFQQMEISDHEKLSRALPVYDARYVYCDGTRPVTGPSRHV